jgi:hypothetical protein
MHKVCIDVQHILGNESYLLLAAQVSSSTKSLKDHIHTTETFLHC